MYVCMYVCREVMGYATRVPKRVGFPPKVSAAGIRPPSTPPPQGERSIGNASAYRPPPRKADPDVPAYPPPQGKLISMC